MSNDDRSSMDDVKLLLGEIRGEMRSRFDAQDRRLDDIAEQTKKTNGRVTALEFATARTDAAKEALSGAQVQVKVEQQERSTKIKWWVGTAIAFAGAVAGVAATVAVFLT